MIIISDTSPLSSLLAIHQLEILPKLYSEIIIPNEVAVELLRMKNRQQEVNQLLASDWLTIGQLNNQTLLHKLLLAL